MEIIITKDTKDIRPGRNKTLKKGTKLTVTKDLGEKYIKAKKAKLIEPDVRPIIKSAEEAEEYAENYQEETKK